MAALANINVFVFFFVRNEAGLCFGDRVFFRGYSGLRKSFGLAGKKLGILSETKTCAE